MDLWLVGTDINYNFGSNLPLL